MARSPNYPGVDLKFAVERAARIWARQQQHAAAAEVVMQNLGYSPKSGPGSTTYGALKRFGLLDEPERGRAALTALGVAIVRGEATGQRDYARLREAALHPKLHKTMWEKYGEQLPDDSVLVFDLRQDGFTDTGARDFLAQWKRTMAFAKLAEAAGTLPEDASVEDSEENGQEPPMTSDAPPVDRASDIPRPVVDMPAMRTIQLPYSRSGWALLQADFPMSLGDWDQMLAVLQAMKPALVESDDD